MMLDKIRIVLIGTTHSGNIGATARAMGNMGFSKLYLVNPKDFPSPVATARASGADHILESAVVCHSLQEALAECVYVVGSSARIREANWPVLSCEEMSANFSQKCIGQSEVALVFGQERAGLTNQELDLCDALVTLPVNPDYPSLNLGAAVMLLCWEVRRYLLQVDAIESQDFNEDLEPPAKGLEMDRFFDHMEQVMSELGFIKFDKPEKLMRKIRHLFLRSRPTSEEVNLLRGLLSSVQFNLRKHID